MKADIRKLFDSEFDRDAQLALVASTLEHLRSTCPAEWQMLGKGERVPEFKNLVSHLIRAADESVDHRATVAYVTRAAHDELEALASGRTRRRANKGDIWDSSRFHHEHATPVEVVLRTVTLSANRDAPIRDILEALCCRVLVTCEERRKIDGHHDWTVPASLEWRKGIGLGIRTLAPSLIPLIRYHEVDPTMALSLIPLGPIHEARLVQLRTLMAASKGADLAKAHAECRRKPGTSFVLSDDIFTGAKRIRLDA